MSHDTKNSDELKESSNWLLYILFSLVIIIWSSSWYLVSKYIDDPDNRGTFGDMFGSVNSLFSGLAFAGIIYTIYIQRKELALQREELSLQREEIKNSTAELAGQKEQMIVQRFENTYFNLLSAQNEIVNTIKLGTVQGRMVFHHLYDVMSNEYNEIKAEKESFNRIFKQHHNSLYHYCRNMVTIIEFVHNTKYIKDEDKKTYVGFLKSQISSFELVLFYYYCFENQHLLLLLNNYDFFSNINKDLILNKERNNEILELLNISESY